MNPLQKRQKVRVEALYKGADQNKMFTAEGNHVTQGTRFRSVVKLIHGVGSREIEVEVFPNDTASSLIGNGIMNTGPNLGPVQKPKIILPFESGMMKAVLRMQQLKV